MHTWIEIYMHTCHKTYTHVHIYIPFMRTHIYTQSRGRVRASLPFHSGLPQQVQPTGASPQLSHELSHELMGKRGRRRHPQQQRGRRAWVRAFFFFDFFILFYFIKYNIYLFCFLCLTGQDTINSHYCFPAEGSGWKPAWPRLPRLTLGQRSFYSFQCF